MSIDLDTKLKIIIMVSFLLLFNGLLLLKTKINNLNTLLLFVIILFVILIKTFIINK